ncbi:MAG: pre-peptidase C-terminal domain-containing protein, partial [Chloroflexota bacterium]
MSTNKPLLILCVLLTLLGGTSVTAQVEDLVVPVEPFDLRPNVPVDENLDDSDPLDTYVFELPEGVTFTLTMEQTSNDLDPLLTLLDENGLVDENDDADQGTRNAQITVDEASGGVYTVEATRFQRENGETEGTYRLTLSVEGLAITDPDIDPLDQSPPYSVAFSEVGYGTFGAGELSEATPQQYFAVPGERGDLLQSILTITS